MTLAPHTTNPVHLPGWVTLLGVGSADEQIDAFEQWRQVYYQEQTVLIQRNINKVADATEQLIAKLTRNQGIAVQTAYLRLSSLYNYTALILVSEGDFLKDTFRDAYVLAQEVEDEVSEEIMELSFSFASLSEYTREDIIYSQGFLLKRTPNSKPAQ